MATVAVDTSAIAPPPPLPTRPDAGPPAGPSGVFANLLDGSASPTPAPQPPASAGGRPDDGSNAAQTNGTTGSGASGTAPAKAGAPISSPRNGKDSGGSKSTTDSSADEDSGGNTAGATAVGFPVPAFAFASLPATDQTPAASEDTQAASVDSAAATQSVASVLPGDHKDSAAPTDPGATGLAAAVPALTSIVTVVAPAASAAAGIGPVAALPSSATVPASTSSASSAGTPAESDQTDVAAPPAQQPNGTGQNSQPPSTSVLELLTAMPSPASAPPLGSEIQTAALPALTAAAANSGAPDRNAPAAPPVIAADAPAGTATPAGAVAALTPPTAVTPPLAQIQVPAETSANPSSPRDAGAVQIALPAQVAMRFAATAHADDDASSDNGSDVLRGFGGASVGATTPPDSGQATAAITPGFTGILSTMQTAPGAPTSPQRPAVATDAVPLAAVPIAIITRAEAGERKFEIRLDPPDLGRIDVQLNVDSSGRATSHLIVDRAATLDLLRRDAPALERALQSAGLTTDNGSLQFSLRDQSFAGREQAPPAPLVTPATASAAESDIAPIDTALRRYGPAAGLGGGIDIRV